MFTIREHFVLKIREKHQCFRSLFLVLSCLLIFMAGNFVCPASYSAESPLSRMSVVTSIFHCNVWIKLFSNISAEIN